jgi:phospholipid/cholesterol/gamma-HCH transport system substrate-binding protein
LKAEFRVGLLFLGGLVAVSVFAYLLGFFSGWSSSNKLYIQYNYAGGIDVGSPVRVMGIRVGKVLSIDFDPSMKTATGEEVKLKIAISVNDSAWSSIKSDSKFYINLAGVIGEKFLEISPGTESGSPLSSGDFIRGEDPPRIDQLISQSYGLAGKIIDIVSKNEGTFVQVLTGLDKLTSNVNKTLVMLEKFSNNPSASKVMSNALAISDDMAHMTKLLRSEKADKTYDLMYRLLNRLEPLDGPAIRKFLQEEGVRAKIF